MWLAWERRGKFIGFFGGKSEGKRPFGRPRRRWEHGIKMDLRKISWGYRLDPVVSG
jgi:hypothetical protein